VLVQVQQRACELTLTQDSVTGRANFVAQKRRGRQARVAA